LRNINRRSFLAAHRSLNAQIGFLLVLVAVFFRNDLFTYKLYFFYDTIMPKFPFGQFFAEGLANSSSPSGVRTSSPGILAAIEAVRRRGMRGWWPGVFRYTFLLGTHPYVVIYAILGAGSWLVFAFFEKNVSSNRILRARWLAVIGGPDRVPRPGGVSAALQQRFHIICRRAVANLTAPLRKGIIGEN